MFEPALEPTERKDQDRINRYAEMLEAETAIKLYLEDYKHLFGVEIDSFLLDLHMAVQDYGEDDV